MAYSEFDKQRKREFEATGKRGRAERTAGRPDFAEESRVDHPLNLERDRED